MNFYWRRVEHFLSNLSQNILDYFFSVYASLFKISGMMTNVFRSQSEALPWYLTTRQTTGIPSPETIRRENRTRSQKTRPRPTTTTETTHRYSRTLGQVGLLSKRTNRKIFGDDAQKAKSVPASRFSW